MVGFAPRGRAELRRLLDVADLDHAVPSTLWDRAADGTWRTGLATGAQPAWQAAAHAAGSVTAWREFTSEDGHRLRLQVVPLATADDAGSALATASDHTAGLRGTDVEDAHDRLDLDAPPRVEGAQWVTASTASTPAGEALTWRGTTGAFLLVAVATGTGWTWTDLAAVVAAQSARLSG